MLHNILKNKKGMAGTENMDELINLVDRTELNAMVIDIKNDKEGLPMKWKRRW